jgi:thiol:disulfide interchange protein
MKKWFIQLLLMALPLSLLAQEQGIRFVKGTFSEALEKAGKENKNVFVDCHTLWCGPCRYMENNVFTEDSVGRYMNSRYVSFKIDMEHGEGPELQKKFKVAAYPTFILFNPEGKELGRFEGSAESSQFIQYVEFAAAGKNVRELQQAQRKQQGQENASIAQEKDTIYDDGKGVIFRELTYAQALEKAKAENKLIFIDCVASWCAPCKKMANTTFKDTRVGNLMNRQFITIEVNVEEGDGKEIAEKYGVKLLPTYLLIDPDGSEYNRFVGGVRVLDFASKLTKAVMGVEDEYVKSQRLQKEQLEKARQERKAHLTANPRTFKPSPVRFESAISVDKAIKKAQKQNKNVFVMFYDECWPADYMLDTVFQEQVASDFLNNRFISLLVDAGSVEGDKLMENYKVEESFPCYVILDGNGQVKAYTGGHFKNGDIFVKSINMLLEGKR